jgi:hypothetical protein
VRRRLDLRRDVRADHDLVRDVVLPCGLVRGAGLERLRERHVHELLQRRRGVQHVHVHGDAHDVCGGTVERVLQRGVQRRERVLDDAGDVRGRLHGREHAVLRQLVHGLRPQRGERGVHRRLDRGVQLDDAHGVPEGDVRRDGV